MSTEVGQNDVVFQSGPVLITTTLAKFGATTYTINGIGSVYIGEKRNTTLLWIALIAGLVAVVLLAQPGNNQGVAIIPGIVAVVCIIAYFARQQFLMLSISSGDKEAYSSSNYAALQEIKAAIERAVTLRG